MDNLSFTNLLLLAITSGVLLALSFPRYGTPAAAWIALVPLLVALSGWNGRGGELRGVPARRAFALGLVAGLVYFVGTVYWTGTVVATFGGLAMPVAVFAMLLLSAYLALYPAMAALVTARLIARAGAAGLFVAPAAWVTTEYLRGILFGGFPWVPLGNSQVTMLPVAQIASVFGVYGVSAVVAGANAVIACALLTRGRSQTAAVVAGVALLAATAGWGTWRMRDGELLRQGTPVRIGLLQGNIAQEDKWNPKEARRIFTTYVAMTRDAARRGAEFIIWPESSTPFMFEEHSEGGAAIRELAREIRVPLLFGSDQIERGTSPRMFNSAFLVAPDGQTSAVYRKIHLVPFGEYIPGKQIISFVSPLVQSLAEFAPGTAMVMLPVNGHRTSTAICYEVVYPSLVREAVLAGSELLTTITNDAWYGQSSAPFQHFAMASMRAIEHGRYLARAANTGISGIIDPYGRVVQESVLFEQVGLVGDARFLTGRTTYSRIGDLIAYVAMAVTALALIAARGPT